MTNCPRTPSQTRNAQWIYSRIVRHARTRALPLGHERPAMCQMLLGKRCVALPLLRALSVTAHLPFGRTSAASAEICRSSRSALLGPRRCLCVAGADVQHRSRFEGHAVRHRVGFIGRLWEHRVQTAGMPVGVGFTRAGSFPKTRAEYLFGEPFGWATADEREAPPRDRGVSPAKGRDLEFRVCMSLATPSAAIESRVELRSRRGAGLDGAELAGAERRGCAAPDSPSEHRSRHAPK